MSAFATEDTIVFGIGNNGRGDDGVGWAFLDKLQIVDFPGALHYRYHLQIEDAILIAGAENVIFVDAFQGKLPNGFLWQPCSPEPQASPFSHGLAPAHLLHLTKELYHKTPPAFLLLIQGADWSLRTDLSEAARLHLEQAYDFWGNYLIDGIQYR